MTEPYEFIFDYIKNTLFYKKFKPNEKLYYGKSNEIDTLRFTSNIYVRIFIFISVL